MMLPIERLDQIKKRILAEKNIKIADLSKDLQVSEMTIHRDLKPLIEEGLVVKTFGGISLANPPTTDNHEVCVYCSRAIHDTLSYRLILSDHTIEIACCAHCGLLRHKQLGDQVIQAICYDFLRQTTISAQQSFFVMDTSIDIGCCQPQVLSFEWEEHAQKFVKGFGGNVYAFNDALTTVFKKMNGTCQHKHT